MLKRCHVSSYKVSSRDLRCRDLTHPTARRTHANSALSSSHESAYRQRLSIRLKPVLLHLAAPGPMVGRLQEAREGNKELEGCKARQVPLCWMLGFGKELLCEAALLLKQHSI